MKLIDIALTIAQRHAAVVTDADTALQQIRVACEQFPADPHKLALDLAMETVRLKTLLAAAKREAGAGR